MFELMRKKQRKISKLVLLFFVLSTLGLATQTSAHSLMMLEMQQHEAMGHDMSSHCQPVLCETVIAQDNLSNNGIDSVALIDLSKIPASFVVAVLSLEIANTASAVLPLAPMDYGAPPLQKTSILLI